MDLSDLLSRDQVGEALYQQRLSALLRLLDVTRTLAAEIDLTKILRIIASEACKALVCQRATVYQYDPVRRQLYTRVATDMEVAEIRRGLDQGISGYVARHRRMLNVPDPGRDPRWSPDTDQATGFQTRNLLAAPLISPRDGELLGVLECLNNEGGPFDAFDEPLLEAFAQHAVAALDRSRLVEDLAQRQAVDVALGIARDVQRRFMPETLPTIEGYEAATWWMPHQEVGGDYCDLVPLRDGRVGLVIADVSGHGLGPSLLMASVRASLRSLLLAHSHTGELLELLNHSLSDDLRDGNFVTMIIAALDCHTHTLEYANAGHAPAVHFAARGNDFTVLTATGLPIGVLKTSDYPLASPLQLRVGDLVLLCTDGIVEAADKSGELFGVERLRDSIREFSELPVGDLVKRLGERVQDFCESRRPADDLTILGLRRLR
ncbi:MAG TPA: GAF domain-containing SpoIIE family protein phosphatase [Pirellulales bacterium]|nr:GAF domain-containing SpoIIE family protein phosphatase [Pirellulales bacterium]